MSRWLSRLNLGEAACWRIPKELGNVICDGHQMKKGIGIAGMGRSLLRVNKRLRGSVYASSCSVTEYTDDQSYSGITGDHAQAPEMMSDGFRTFGLQRGNPSAKANTVLIPLLIASAFPDTRPEELENFHPCYEHVEVNALFTETMHSNRRYRPYPPPATPVLRPPPAPSPQTRQLFKTAREQLDFYNSAGVLVTWAGNDWELVSRPTRKTANSSILVGAASFPSVPNFSYPRCPHLDAHGHPYAPMELNLGKKLNHIKKDFFKAGDHICDFIVLIPKVRPTVYSTSEDDDEPSLSSPSSSSSLSSIDEVDSLINWNPRVPASTSTTPATSPISSPTPTPLRKKRAFIHTSRFSESVSAARALSDVRVLNACWDGVITGQFDVNPSSQSRLPSTRRFHPPCLAALRRGFQSRKSYETAPTALRANVNSAMMASTAISAVASAGIALSQLLSPQKPSVERLPHELAIRELPPGKQLGTEAEFLESPIGATLLEWNSPLGVPLDVWAMASTATTECETCKLCRTFPAHGAHLHLTTGVCNDLVDKEAGSD
ncbi:hypothetical protein B0H14DRAFT_3743473 [Mycena olivaceomarginata]|nr:hypothetical protein B0H14DRAFT_3743473 [Mycena olivaceomarginata]